jgi:UDP-N-acetylglucosamine 3-dehydrogenase
MNLRIGVIGVGSMGLNHARVCADLPDVVVAGIADQNLAAAEAAAARYGGRAYADYRQLLAGETLDAAVIAVPTVDHHEVGMAAIERGLHLLIEKPIAYTVDEAQSLIAAAEAAGVCLMIGHIERFNPAVMALKTRLEAGELGKIFQIDAHRQGPFPARVKDVGVVIDLAVHDLDVMRYITGAEISRVFAETERRIHSSREDLLTGLARLDDGTVGTLNINWLTPTKIRELFVTGEQGMFRVDYLTQDLYFYENGLAPTEEWPLRVLRGVSEGRMIRHVVPKREPLRNELEAFVAAARGEAPVAVTGPDGLKALQLAEAVVASGQKHEVVRM